MFNVELVDALGPFTDTAFGFFFLNNPDTLVPIFGPDDDGPPAQLAVVDFFQGIVFDQDEGAPQSAFAGTGPIGFFLAFATPSGPMAFYSTPFLNPGGIDPVATFPSFGEPFTYLIAFENPVVAGVPLAVELSSGLRPVPEPSTLLLWAAAGFGLLVNRRSVARGRPGQTRLSRRSS